MNRLHRFVRTVLTGRRTRPRDELLLEEFQRVIGVRFHDAAVLRQALTHRSFVYDTGGDASQSNERMEFLGDSVLGLVVNDHLFKFYPHHREGTLTQMKSLLVSEAVLSKMARTMNLGRYLFLSTAESEAGGRDRSSILADAFEAVIGAIYIDSGIEAARAFCEDRLLVDAGAIVLDRSNRNYKSLLQEYAQGHYKTHPRYRVTDEEGPDHEKVFQVEVFVGTMLMGRGAGKNKKDAEQDAACDAIHRLEEEHGPIVSSSMRGVNGVAARRPSGRGAAGGRGSGAGASGGASRSGGSAGGGRSSRAGTARSRPAAR
jgi:ribonuclease-3